jgi:hypothetical protein
MEFTMSKFATELDLYKAKSEHLERQRNELREALKEQCEWIWSQIAWAQADEYMNEEPADSFSYECYLQASKFSSLLGSTDSSIESSEGA